jgi:hypothetical protein
MASAISVPIHTDEIINPLSLYVKREGLMCSSLEHEKAKSEAIHSAAVGYRKSLCDHQ